MRTIIPSVLALLFFLSNPAMKGNAEIWHSTLAAEGTVGDILAGHSSDTMIHLTTATEQELATATFPNFTLADTMLYNYLTGRRLHLPRVPANLVSTSVGMLLGFALHYSLVFQPVEAALPARILRYAITVGISVYGVQSAVIYALAKVWRGPVHLVQAMSGGLNLGPNFSNDFLDRMTGKLAAAVVGMIWNFVFFKFFVYAA